MDIHIADYHFAVTLRQGEQDEIIPGTIRYNPVSAANCFANKLWKFKTDQLLTLIQITGEVIIAIDQKTGRI